MGTQVFTYDVPAELLFNDGEGLDYNDLNDMQRIARRSREDGFFAQRYFLAGTLMGVHLRPLFFALSIKDSTGMDVKVTAGSVLWQLSSDPGEPEPQYILAKLEADQVITVDAADATFDRWDILTAKVEWSEGDSETRDFEDGITRVKTTQVLDKRRRTKLTITYTPGTPSASPSEPTPPSGEEKFARIEVPATASSLTSDNLKDFRFPCGYTRYIVPEKTWWTDDSDFWDLVQAADANIYWNVGATGHKLYVPLTYPALSHVDWSRQLHLRMGRIMIYSELEAGVTVKIRARFPDASSMDLLDLSAYVDTSGVLTRNDLALTGLDPPCWMNGHQLAAQDQHDEDCTAFLEVITATSGLHVVRAVAIEYYGIAG